MKVKVEDKDEVKSGEGDAILSSEPNKNAVLKPEGMKLLAEIKKTTAITSEQIDEIDVDVVELCNGFLNTLDNLVKNSADERIKISAINAFFDNSSKLHAITTQIATRTSEKLKNLEIIRKLESPIQEIIQFKDSPIKIDVEGILLTNLNKERDEVLLYIISKIDEYRKEKVAAYSKFENRTSESVLRITIDDIVKIMNKVVDNEHRDEKHE